MSTTPRSQAYDALTGSEKQLISASGAAWPHVHILTSSGMPLPTAVEIVVARQAAGWNTEAELVGDMDLHRKGVPADVLLSWVAAGVSTRDLRPVLGPGPRTYTAGDLQRLTPGQLAAPGIREGLRKGARIDDLMALNAIVDPVPPGLAASVAGGVRVDDLAAIARLGAPLRGFTEVISPGSAVLNETDDLLRQCTIMWMGWLRLTSDVASLLARLTAYEPWLGTCVGLYALGDRDLVEAAAQAKALHSLDHPEHGQQATADVGTPERAPVDQKGARVMLNGVVTGSARIRAADRAVREVAE